MKQKKSNLGTEMAWFGTPSQTHQPAHSVEYSWKTLVIDVKVVNNSIGDALIN